MLLSAVGDKTIVQISKVDKCWRPTCITLWGNAGRTSQEWHCWPTWPADSTGDQTCKTDSPCRNNQECHYNTGCQKLSKSLGWPMTLRVTKVGQPWLGSLELFQKRQYCWLPSERNWSVGLTQDDRGCSCFLNLSRKQFTCYFDQGK
jgi:hypothetical protein